MKKKMICAAVLLALVSQSQAVRAEELLTDGIVELQEDLASGETETGNTICEEGLASEVLSSVESDTEVSSLPCVERPRSMQRARVRVYNSAKGADIQWTKVDGATSYMIYRQRAAEGTKQVAKVGAGTLQYIDPYIKSNCWGKVYQYFVVPYFGDQHGEESQTAVLQRLSPPEIVCFYGMPHWDTIINKKMATMYVTFDCKVGEDKCNGYEVQLAETLNDLYYQGPTFRAQKVGRSFHKEAFFTQFG